jgi:L-alanine-DL-glutamate epimerase-like enolase superfamily enzyme
MGERMRGIFPVLQTPRRAKFGPWQDGYISLPDTPGLGIDIDWEAINPSRIA